MTGALLWDPPSTIAVAAGIAALVVWLALARPRTGAPLGGALRIGAGLLLLLALLDVGCRRTPPAGGRLAVLVDRSASMELPAGATTRAEQARAWLESRAFADWAVGWDVVVDSFGGATSDPGAAVEAAAAELPGAIVLVSDGRAAGGRAVDPPSVPLYARVPGPTTLADAAVLDVTIETPGGADPVAVVELAAVGGAPVPDGRRLTVMVDGRVAGGVDVGRLEPGGRRTMRIALSGIAGGERVIEARLEPPDAVPDNDRRGRVWLAGSEARRALVVGLAPGWELAAWRRALERSRSGPVDVFWSADGRALRPAEGGPERPWDALDPAHYRTAVVVGDPALAVGAGARWIGRLLAPGGRGLAWVPEGHSGALVGTGVEVPAPGGDAAPPTETRAGRGWRAEHGATPSAAPDGGAGWPAIERLPRAPVEVPAGTVPLLVADGRPVAWVGERGANRVAVLLGSGYYRWALAGEGPAEYWEAFSRALARWLDAASEAAEAPLVRLPVAGRFQRGEPLVAPLAGDAARPVGWRVQRDGETVVDGVADTARAIRPGPLTPGEYALEARAADGRRARRRFLVEAWAPDLAWTAADSAGLARAARASGGGVLAAAPGPPLGTPPTPAAAASLARSGPGLGRRPWTYLAVALLLLADWAFGGGSLARRTDGR